MRERYNSTWIRDKRFWFTCINKDRDNAEKCVKPTFLLSFGYRIMKRRLTIGWKIFNIKTDVMKESRKYISNINCQMKSRIRGLNKKQNK